MVKVLQDIWILKPSGTIIFNRVFDEEFQSELFGMLMSALNSFALSLSKNELKNFEFSKKRYTIKKVNDYLFVANSSKKRAAKKVNQELENLSEIFFETYERELLEECDGDVSKLTRCEEIFKERIKESLEEPVKQFWEGIVNR